MTHLRHLRAEMLSATHGWRCLQSACYSLSPESRKTSSGILQRVQNFRSVKRKSCLWATGASVLTTLAPSHVGHYYRILLSILPRGECSTPKRGPSQACTDGWIQLQPLWQAAQTLGDTSPSTIYPSCLLVQVHLAPAFVESVTGPGPKCYNPNRPY